MKKIILSALKVYSRWISPALPRSCRFLPSCSDYSRQAVERYGASRGIILTAGRLLRCHPFHPGGYDPVPGKTPDSKFQIPNSKMDLHPICNLESLSAIAERKALAKVDGIWNSSEIDLTTQRNEHHG